MGASQPEGTQQGVVTEDGKCPHTVISPDGHLAWIYKKKET